MPDSPFPESFGDKVAGPMPCPFCDGEVAFLKLEETKGSISWANNHTMPLCATYKELDGQSFMMAVARAIIEVASEQAKNVEWIKETKTIGVRDKVVQRIEMTPGYVVFSIKTFIENIETGEWLVAEVPSNIFSPDSFAVRLEIPPCDELRITVGHEKGANLPEMKIRCMSEEERQKQIDKMMREHGPEMRHEFKKLSEFMDKHNLKVKGE